MNINKVAFSGPDSRMSVFTDENGELYLTIAVSYGEMNERKKLVRILPVDGAGNALPFTCDLRIPELLILTELGTIRMCMKNDLLRIFSDGPNLRMLFKPSESTFECACDAGGAVEAMMFLTGKLLFVPISGAISNTARWDTKKAQSEDYHIDLLKNPSEESLEFAVHQYYSNGERLPEYERYDSFLSSIDGEFKEFLRENGFSGTPSLSAAWLLWTNIMNTGYRKNLLAVIPGKLGYIAAVGWQQALFSLAFSQNPRIGKKLILDYLGAQIENGPLPQSVADIHINTLHSTAPLFGYALEKNATLPEHCSPSELRRIYDGMSSNTDWWLSRWNPRELRPAYFHPKKAGAIPDSYAMEDLPVMTPDLLVWLIFQCDACGRLSSILSISGASAMWANCAEILLELLKNELWDGLHFCALSLNTGKKHPIKSISRIIPMLLHKRLGDKIYGSLKEDLLSSFLTERGISSFEKDSPTDVDSAVQLMFALLFHEAGDCDLFARILDAQEAEFSRGTQGESSEAGDEPLTSLSAACWLAMRRMGQSFGQCP